MIYFAQGLDGGAIEIGYTANLAQRIKALESTYKCPLAILATMDGDRQEEATIHDQFSHLRLGRTEQFRPAADLLAFIGRPLLVSADPDTVEAMATPDDRVAIIHLKGSPEYAAWLESLHRKTYIAKASLVRRGLEALAKEIGFEPPPEL